MSNYVLLQIEANESIPSNVCGSCLTTIINFHNLLLQFQETEQLFKRTNIETHILKSDIDDNTINYVEDPLMNENSQIDERYDTNSETLSGKDSEETYDYHIIENEKDDDCVNNQNTDDEYQNNYEEKYMQSTEQGFSEDIECNENVKNIDILKNNEVKCENEDLKCADIKNDPWIHGSNESEKLLEETDTEIILESLKYSCEKCGDSFLLKLGFNQHMLQKHNLHLREKDYALYCSKVIIKQPKMFPEIIKLPKTIVSKLNNQFKCRICSESFENASILKEHMNIHKTHICPVCGVAFLKKYYLTDHLNVHSEERNFVCHICNARFKHRNGLTAHKNSHKIFRDHTCEICGSSFKDNGTLKIHIKLKHNDERKFPCPECPLKFKLRSFLAQHFTRRHTKRTKDFVCSDCGMAYLNKTTLLRHISEKHSGKNPQHVCAVCNKTFRFRLSLNKHLQIIHKTSVIK